MLLSQLQGLGVTLHSTIFCKRRTYWLFFCLLVDLLFSSLLSLWRPPPCRRPGLSRKQFGLSSGRQPTTLAQIPAGAHRDGRPGRLSSAHSPAPPHRPPRCPPPPPPQSRRRLGSLPAPTHSQPRQPVPLPAPRLPDRLQTPRTAHHRAATECRCGPPLNTHHSRHPSTPTPPRLSHYYPLILYPRSPFPLPDAIHTNLQIMEKNNY